MKTWHEERWYENGEWHDSEGPLADKVVPTNWNTMGKQIASGYKADNAIKAAKDGYIEAINALEASGVSDITAARDVERELFIKAVTAIESERSKEYDALRLEDKEWTQKYIEENRANRKLKQGS